MTSVPLDAFSKPLTLSDYCAMQSAGSVMRGSQTQEVWVRPGATRSCRRDAGNASQTPAAPSEGEAGASCSCWQEDAPEDQHSCLTMARPPPRMKQFQLQKHLGREWRLPPACRINNPFHQSWLHGWVRSQEKRVCLVSLKCPLSTCCLPCCLPGQPACKWA